MSNVLSTGTGALIAFQRALATVSHNVANINTEGYSRQKVNFATADPQNYGYGTVGNGTRITDIRRTADQLAISRLLDSSGELARLKQLFSLFEQRTDLRRARKAAQDEIERRKKLAEQRDKEASARAASDDSAPATSRNRPSKRAAMRWTAPMNAPSPPPTMPRGIAPFMPAPARRRPTPGGSS